MDACAEPSVAAIAAWVPSCTSSTPRPATALSWIRIYPASRFHGSHRIRSIDSSIATAAEGDGPSADLISLRKPHGPPCRKVVNRDPFGELRFGVV